MEESEILTMRPIALALALFASAASVSAAGQEAPDTTVTIQGFVQQHPDSGIWTIVVPLPFEARGYRTFVLPIQGKADRWKRFLGRYVEAAGRVSPAGIEPVGIAVDGMREVVPPGTSHHTIQRGLTVHAEITLAVIPNRFAWRDARGAPTGVNPVLLYTITNKVQAPIRFLMSNNDLLCIGVASAEGQRLWDHVLQAPSPSTRRIFVQRGGAYRETVQLPEEAASRPGHYVAQAALCAVSGYDASTAFEVR